MQSLSTGEIAKICNVNPRTVIRWIDRGKIQAHKLPGRGNNRVARNDLLLFLKDSKIPIPPYLANVEDNTITIIESDARISKNLQRLARKVGYDTKIIDNALEAGFWLSSGLPTKVVFVDLRMTGLPQKALMLLIDKLNPLVSIIVATDDEKLMSVLENNNRVTCVTSKPISNNDILTTLENIQDFVA